MICNYLQLIQVSIQNSSVDRPFNVFFLSGDYFMYMLDFCESVCNLKINTKQYKYKVRKMMGQIQRNLTLAKQKRLSNICLLLWGVLCFKKLILNIELGNSFLISNPE